MPIKHEIQKLWRKTPNIESINYEENANKSVENTAKR